MVRYNEISAPQLVSLSVYHSVMSQATHDQPQTCFPLSMTVQSNRTGRLRLMGKYISTVVVSRIDSPTPT